MSIDYILQPKRVDLLEKNPSPPGFDEVMHGTPDLVTAWLKHMPNMAGLLYVKDMEFDLIVTARQYIERHDTGATSYSDPVQ